MSANSAFRNLRFLFPSRYNKQNGLHHMPSRISLMEACEALRREPMYDLEQLRRLSFRSAANLLLEARRNHLKKGGSFYLYGQHLKRLETFFGERMVTEIHIGDIKAYQQERRENAAKRWPRVAGASTINHEIAALADLLKRAGEWARIEPHYEPLRTPPPQSPRVLSDVEETMFFQVAAQNPDWEVAYWVASITCNTGASGTELRNLQRKELQLDARVPFFFIKSETGNNEGRGRPVVLNETALKQMRRCVERAIRLGSTGPDHYLFPWRKGRGKHDPTRPATVAWLRRPWRELCEAAGFPDLTPHCFRHQHITLRLESGAPIKLVAKDVGHSAVAMTRYYTHLHRERQPQSVSRIDPRVRFGTQRARPLAEKKLG